MNIEILERACRIAVEQIKEDSVTISGPTKEMEIASVVLNYLAHGLKEAREEEAKEQHKEEIQKHPNSPPREIVPRNEFELPHSAAIAYAGYMGLTGPVVIIVEDEKGSQGRFSVKLVTQYEVLEIEGL